MKNDVTAKPLIWTLQKKGNSLAIGRYMLRERSDIGFAKFNQILLASPVRLKYSGYVRLEANLS